MTTPEQVPHLFQNGFWQQPTTRRWIVVGVVLIVLFVLGFFTVTNELLLHSSHVLEGADWMGYAICHRITERSFTINGRQFPLCARCTGMYLGVALILLLVFLSGRTRRSELPPLPLLLILLGLIGLMGIDGLNSYSHFFPNAPHLYTPQNWLRLLTGMGTGVAMGLLILPVLAQTLWRNASVVGVITSGRELFLILFLAGLLVLLILSNRPTILYVLALGSTVGLLFIVASLNTIILLVITRRDGRVESGLETAVPMLIGLIFAIIELSTISILRLLLTGTMTGFPGL